jgi:predicted HTH domain antitoxin
MPTSTSLELPFDLFEAARLKPDEVRRELALHLFREEKLSFGKARELAGMDASAFLHLLGAQGIPIHYDVAEYEEDLKTLRSLGRS